MSEAIENKPAAPVKNRLEDWAARQGDRIAIVDDADSITWREWNERSDRLAQAMRKAGIVEDDVVVARMHNRIGWAILYGALAKLSCTMLGMNWRLTAPEVHYLLRNSKARAFFCDDADPSLLLPTLDSCDLLLKVSVDQANGFEHLPDLLEQPAEALYSRHDPQLIIYTSGTTGFPKGVLVNRHKRGENNTQLTEYLQSIRGEAPAGDNTVLVTMPMHHAAGPSIVRTAISRGNTMIFMGRFDPERSLQLIQEQKITTWNGVPTMFKRIAALPGEVLRRYDVSSIRSLSVGAAPVGHDLKMWIIDYFGDCLKENYGSTEASMVAGLTPDMQRRKPGSSGLPFKHVEISVRDQDGNELPRGEVGDIWVRTPALVDRYVNSPRMEEDVLDKNGFFRMGDVGRLDEDGYLYITDRSKDMIISGGVNIYPAEVEVVLLSHPAIQDAAIIGIPDDEFGERVKAFCEMKAGSTVTEADLLAFAEPRLASYKRPKSVEFVAELPRNTMGKVLKRELREPYWQDRERKV